MLNPRTEAQLIKCENVYAQSAIATGSVPFFHYNQKPVEFCESILDFHPTPDQKNILLSVRDNPITNVKAAHGIGKSSLSACIVLYHVFAVGGLAITTAPTEDQVKQILWSEIRKLYDRHKHRLGGSRGELFVRYSESARAYGFTSRNYDSNSFQGKHAEKLLLIGDEYDGISEVIDDGFRSCLTGSENRGLRIGNPLDPGSPFAKACEINCLTIKAWNHPNVSWAYREVMVNGKPIHRLKPEVAELILDFKGRVKPRSQWASSPILQPEVIPGAISIKWIEDARLEKGEGSAFWISRIEAEYPTDKADGIIPITELRKARARYDSDPEYWDNLASSYEWVLGLDVGDGGDPHAIALRRGMVFYSVEIHPTKGDMLDTLRAAEIASNKLSILGSYCKAYVDNTGVGAGSLAELKKKGWIANGCKFGNPPQDKQTFVNRKIELYWTFRELLRKELTAIAPLGEKEEYIFEELAAPRYFTNTKDQLMCEPKTKTRSRLGRSTDAADAIIITLESQIPTYGV